MECGLLDDQRYEACVCDTLLQECYLLTVCIGLGLGIRMQNQSS